jgi:hypothetical protein
MTQDEIIEMARQVIDLDTDKRGRNTFLCDEYGLEAFAKLVAQHEREKFCAVLRQLHDSYSLASDSNAIKAALEAKDEPWEKFCDSNCVWSDHHPDCKLAQRTWVGLTNEDLANCSTDEAQWAFYWEKLLKEKNT